MTARPDSRATPAPTASNIAAVILASAMSGTLSICDAPSARQAAIISFVVLFLAPATDHSPLQRHTGPHIPGPMRHGSQLVHHRGLQTRRNRLRNAAASRQRRALLHDNRDYCDITAKGAPPGSAVSNCRRLWRVDVSGSEFAVCVAGLANSGERCPGPDEVTPALTLTFSSFSISTGQRPFMGASMVSEGQITWTHNRVPLTVPVEVRQVE